MKNFKVNPQVSQALKDSGLFRYTSHGESWMGYPLDADESESILAEMGLQVVISDDEDWVIAESSSAYCQLDTYGHYYYVHRLDGVLKGQRTLANNAALAWLCQQEAWKPKLQAALERLGWV